MAIPFVLPLEEHAVLRGDYFPARQPSLGTVIVCHGFKGFKDWGFFPYLGEQLAERMDAITFNFSHNGIGEDLQNFTELEKFARNTYTRELSDLHALVEAVQDGKLPLQHGGSMRPAAHPLFLLGHSKGAGTSLIYAMDHAERIAGVVSWNGVTRTDIYSNKEKELMLRDGRAYTQNSRTKQQMPLDRIILEDMDANRERFDIVKRIRESAVPIVLVQGTDDYPRLREGSEQLIRQRPDIVWHRIPGGNHTFGAAHPFMGTTEPLNAAIRITKQWLYDRAQEAVQLG